MPTMRGLAASSPTRAILVKLAYTAQSAGPTKNNPTRPSAGSSATMYGALPPSARRGGSLLVTATDSFASAGVYSFWELRRGPRCGGAGAPGTVRALALVRCDIGASAQGRDS